MNTSEIGIRERVPLRFFSAVDETGMLIRISSACFRMEVRCAIVALDRWLGSAHG